MSSLSSRHPLLYRHFVETTNPGSLQKSGQPLPSFQSFHFLLLVMACRTNGILILSSGKSLYPLGTRASDQAEVKVVKVKQVPQVVSKSERDKSYSHFLVVDLSSLPTEDIAPIHLLLIQHTYCILEENTPTQHPTLGRCQHQAGTIVELLTGHSTILICHWLQEW